MKPRHIVMPIIPAAMATVCALGADGALLVATYGGLAPLFLAQIRGAMAADTRRSA